MSRISVVIILLFLSSMMTTLPVQAADERCFTETGFCLSGRIRSFWEQNGGLPVFGYPTGPQHEEQVEDRVLQLQHFERNRLELHPENRAPYDVLIGRLGVDVLTQQGRGDWQEFSRSGENPNCRVFAETGQQVCDAILRAWRANGLEFDGRRGKSEAESLALFGLPISPESQEVLEGHVYTVQWFERARFELHPEHSPPYDVLLGLLGNEMDAPPITPISAGAEIDSLTTVGSQVFFSARTNALGIELWRSDGTVAGTTLVRDLAPGPALGWPRHLAALGNNLLFAARSTDGGPDLLWRSDGTEAGTYPLLQANQLTDPWQITVTGSTAFFIGSDTAHGEELWATDGTPEGTRLVRDIYPGPESSRARANMPMGYLPFTLTRVGDRMFFTAEAPDTGYGLWVSDGTTDGTRFVGKIGQDAEYWYLTELNDALIFVGRTGRLNYGIYDTAGSAITLVKDVSYPSDPGNIRLYPPVSDLTAVGNLLYFTGPGGALWRTDGTPAGTTVGNLFLGGPVAGIGTNAYYLSYSSQAGLLLMDASAPYGGGVVKNIAPTLTGATGTITTHGDTLFIAIQGRERGELWISDGTTTGTRPLQALHGRVAFVQPSSFSQHAVVGHQFFFVADDGVHGAELWASDGTPDGTWLVRDINQSP